MSNSCIFLHQGSQSYLSIKLFNIVIAYFQSSNDHETTHVNQIYEDIRPKDIYEKIAKSQDYEWPMGVLTSLRALSEDGCMQAVHL